MKHEINDLGITYHEYFTNVLHVWAYKNGRRAGLGPFLDRRAVQNDFPVYHYQCSEDSRAFTTVADLRTESLICTYSYCDGHGNVCKSIMLHHEEIPLKEKDLNSLFWDLVKEDSFGFLARNIIQKEA